MMARTLLLVGSGGRVESIEKVRFWLSLYTLRANRPAR
jgi:hypothetical protein